MLRTGHYSGGARHDSNSTAQLYYLALAFLENPLGYRHYRHIRLRSGTEDVRKALSVAIERQGTWWMWELRAQAEPDPEKREQIYRTGLIQFPDSAPLIGTLAVFLTDIRKSHEEAERLFHRALEFDTTNAYIMGNFASFLTNTRKNYEEAERLYRRALELDPSIVDNIANFASFLIIRNRIDEAKQQLERAWRLNGVKSTQAYAEIAFYTGLIALLEGLDDAQALGRLKSVLACGFDRVFWSFDEILLVITPKIDIENRNLYTAAAAAILDPDKMEDLNRICRWDQIIAISLDMPQLNELKPHPVLLPVLSQLTIYLYRNLSQGNRHKPLFSGLRCQAQLGGVTKQGHSTVR